MKANAHVRIGPLVVTFKVVNGRHGLFVAPPVGQYKGRDGRPRFIRWVRFHDPDLQAEVEGAVIEAYHDRVRETGGRMPEPMQPKPDPVQQLIRQASGHISPAVARGVVRKLQRVARDKTLTARERGRAGLALARILIAHYARDTAALEAVGRLRRSERAGE